MRRTTPEDLLLRKEGGRSKPAPVIPVASAEALAYVKAAKTDGMPDLNIIVRRPASLRRADVELALAAVGNG